MANIFDQFDTPTAPAAPAATRAAKGNVFDQFDAAPPATPSLAWGDVPGQALYNAPASAGQFVGDIWTAVTNPIDTVGSLGDLGAGAMRETARYFLPESAFNAIDSIGNQEAAKRASNTAGAVGQFYADRYGSVDGWKNAIATDPVGVMSDLSLPLTGGGSALVKGAEFAGKAPQLAKVASTAAKVGRGAQFIGNVADPAAVVVKGAKQAGKAVGAVDNAIAAWASTPHNLAMTEVARLGDEAFGPYNAMDMDRSIHMLGPEAVRVDVLGEPGRGAVRRQTNINPTARQTVKEFAFNRQDGQNVRLARDLQTQADLPVGSRLSVDDLREAAAATSRPAIDRAYQGARAAGNEIDFNQFDNIITTPVGAPIFRQAIDNVTSRAARNPSAGGNLAVLDETRRLLAGKAEQAYAARDPMAGEYAATARALTEQLDSVLSNDVYAEARSLRQQAHRADEAFTLGEELGQRNVPIDAPSRGSDIGREHTPHMAHAYAQTKVQDLLNNNDTRSALSGFTTDQGRSAYMTGLGSENGSRFGQSVEREGTYRRLPEALGNSTSVQQLIEAGAPSSGALAAGRDGGFGALLLGSDPLTALSVGGVMALVKKFGSKALDNLVSQRRMDAAPIAAQALVGKGALPSMEAVQPGRVGRAADRVANMDPQKAARALLAVRQGGIVNDIASQFGGPR